MLISKLQTNSKSKSINPKPYNIEERTLEFGKRIIRLCKALPTNKVNDVLIRQLMRSGTSIGANYREANETDTKKDFRNRIRISKKEAKETIYWLELIIEANPNIGNRIKLLLQENLEIMKILGSIYFKSSTN
jgi:four helix bundle protein